DEEIHMAWLEKRANRYRIVFRYGNQKYFQSLKKADEKEAYGCLARLEENLRLVERGRLVVPPGADLGIFLLSEGKLNGTPVIEKPMTLGELFSLYQEKLPQGAKEKNTRYTETIHLAHLRRLLGAKTTLMSVTTEALQRYVEARSAETGMG